MADRRPEEVLTAISELMRSPGWELFVQALDMAQGEAERLMTDPKSSAHQAAMGIGSFHTIRQLLSWPMRTTTAYRQFIEAREREARSGQEQP